MLLHEKLQSSWFSRCAADSGGNTGGNTGGGSDRDQAAQDADNGPGKDGGAGHDMSDTFGLGEGIVGIDPGPTSLDKANAQAVAAGERAGIYGGISTDHDPGAAASAVAGLSNAAYTNPNSVFGQTVANLTAGVLSMSPLGQLISGVTEGRSPISTGLNALGVALGNPMSALGLAQGVATMAKGGETPEKDSPGPFGLGGYDSVGSAIGAGLGLGSNASGVVNATGVSNAPNTPSDAGTDVTSSNYTGTTHVPTTLNNNSNNNIPTQNTNNNQTQSLGSPLVPIAMPNNMQLNPDLYANTFNQNATNNGSSQRIRPFLDPFGRTAYQNY